MRPPGTNHTIIYVRFHKDIDEIISSEAAKADKPRAALVASVISQYVNTLKISNKMDPDSITAESANLSALAQSYFAKLGRSDERILGKPLRVTLNVGTDSFTRSIAQALGYSIAQMRTAIMVTWAVKNHLL